MAGILNGFLNPFRSAGRVNRVLLGTFTLINGLVLINACLHDPRVGYDAGNHLKYVQTLATFRLPAFSDSREFFSPPLPYVFPAMLVAIGSVELWWAAKLAQLLNVALSVGLTFYLVKTCDLVGPGKLHLKIVSLGLLGLLPVYYRTFAYVRGEPFVAFFAVFAVYQLLTVFLKDQENWARIATIGLAMGLMGLSRQWAFTLFPAILLFAGLLAKFGRRVGLFLRLAVVSLSISLAVAGWFYLHLLVDYGTAAAFNKEPSPRFSFTNQPADFYFGLGWPQLFQWPIRSSFPNQFVPIFYSEIWGDYWGYFAVYGKDTRTGDFIPATHLEAIASEDPPPEWLETNRRPMGAYLGRVNLVSLFPTAIALGGLGLGVAQLVGFVRRRSVAGEAIAISFFALLIVTSLAGYFWFLVMYPSIGKGDTIKATYQLHIFPFVAILAGELLERLRQKSAGGYTAIIGGLAIVFVHNLPAMITHFVRFRP